MKIEKLRQIFVSIERFQPVEKLVYGAVGIVLVTFLLGLVKLIFGK